MGAEAADISELDAIRESILAVGLEALVVDDLGVVDLELVEWSGSATHVRAIAAALGRRTDGSVEYLAVRAPSGQPVAIGGIDYVAHPGAGTIWQLATQDGLRSLGLGSLLIGEAERRIVGRGLLRSLLGVEDANPRARVLYERLGYVPTTREVAEWDQEGPTGEVEHYETEVTILEKLVRHP